MDWERLGKAMVGAAKSAADTAVHASKQASKAVAGELVGARSPSTIPARESRHYESHRLVGVSGPLP